MKIDSVISNTIIDISNEYKIDLEKVRSSVNALYDTTTFIIENEKPGIIKLDYFGKFIFSSAWKRKMQDIRTKLKEDGIKNAIFEEGTETKEL